MTPLSGIPGDEPHGRWSVDKTVWHTCHTDIPESCFCVYEALAQPTTEAVEIARLRDALGLLRGYVPMDSEGWRIINDALALGDDS
jgi:hypothetical protein